MPAGGGGPDPRRPLGNVPLCAPSQAPLSACSQDGGRGQPSPLTSSPGLSGSVTSGLLWASFSSSLAHGRRSRPRKQHVHPEPRTPFFSCGSGSPPPSFQDTPSLATDVQAPAPWRPGQWDPHQAGVQTRRDGGF